MTPLAQVISYIGHHPGATVTDAMRGTQVSLGAARKAVATAFRKNWLRREECHKDETNVRFFKYWVTTAGECVLALPVRVLTKR